MGQKPDNFTKLSGTLSLCEFSKGGAKGVWLYDETRGMNLALRCPTEREAFVAALHYYQEKLAREEQEHSLLKMKVDSFVESFIENEE